MKPDTVEQIRNSYYNDSWFWGTANFMGLNKTKWGYADLFKEDSHLLKNYKDGVIVILICQ